MLKSERIGLNYLARIKATYKHTNKHKHITAERN